MEIPENVKRTVEAYSSASEHYFMCRRYSKKVMLSSAWSLAVVTGGISLEALILLGIDTPWFRWFLFFTVFAAGSLTLFLTIHSITQNYRRLARQRLAHKIELWLRLEYPGQSFTAIVDYLSASSNSPGGIRIAIPLSTGGPSKEDILKTIDHYESHPLDCDTAVKSGILEPAKTA